MIYKFTTEDGHIIETDGRNKKEAVEKAKQMCRTLGYSRKITEI